MNLFGPHIHRPGMGLDLLGRGRFAAALAMDVDSEYVRKVREKSPGTILVVRVYEDGAQFLEWAPEAWVARLLAKFPEEKPDYFVTINEPFGHDSSELFERFDIWEAEVIRLLQAAGTDGLACNFGTGNFTSGPDRVKIPDVFPRICAVANCMGPHDYSWPSLEAGWGWYAGRWFAWYDDIKEATGREMKFLVGECGLTQAIIAGRPDHGWQSESPEGVTAESYLATLHEYLQRVVTWDAGRGIVLGLCIFNFYDQFHWSFEHVDKPEVVDAIIGMDVPAPPPPEPPPNGGNMIRVFDLDGNELSEEAGLDRIAFHGITVHEPQNMREGEWYWAVVKMRESMGPACFIYTGLLEDGSVAAGQEAAWAWADDMGEADDINGENYPTDWQKEADLGFLNENGNMGPAYGQHGWFHAPYEPGPGRAWIRDPLRWAVKLTGMGMLDMTNHHTMFATWQLKQWGGGEPPEPPVPPDEKLDEILRQVLANQVLLLEILETPPPKPPPDTPWSGWYFNNVTLSDPPALIRNDEEINFSWGEGSPAPEVNANDFSVRWTAKKTFEARMYTFDIWTDDGFRLWVDGELIFDSWKDQAPHHYVVTKAMTAGQHDLKVEFYERGGGATCKLAII